jgi:signal peptidase II
MRAFWISATLAFAADQLSKLIVVHWLDLKTVLAMDPFPPLLRFRMGWNTGINFGLFSDAPEISRWLLVVLALGVSVLLWRWSGRFARPVARVAGGLLVGGALANAFDRVLYGAVADFLNMSCCGIQNPFAFNVADIFIFAGAIGLVLWGEDRRAKAP